MTRARKVLFVLVGVVLYLVTSVPVGLFIYTAKSELGIDVFEKTGFHGYLSCLQSQSELIVDDGGEAEEGAQK